MAEVERRVVLLARAGVACERLRDALSQAGVHLVLEGDPTVLDPAALDAANPDVVVVVLDPAAEDALDRFENVLVDPSIEVIFEEAELAVSREGWDAARWARHLSAKLNRHDDVLPPGREPEPEPGLSLSAAEFQRPAVLTAPLAQEPVQSVDEPELGFDSVQVDPAGPAHDLDFDRFQSHRAGSHDPGVDSIRFDEDEGADAADAPTAHSADADSDRPAFDHEAFDGIVEIEAIEAFEVSEPATDVGARELDFDALSLEPASDHAAFAAAEQIGELERVAPTGSAGDRILTEAPPLPEEAREFFARQALGSTPLSAHPDEMSLDPDVVEIEAYAADEPHTDARDSAPEPDFDFAGLTLEAVDVQAAVPGEARPYTPGLDEWIPSDSVQADLPALDSDGLGDMQAWHAPPPREVHELVDLDAAFAAEGARIDFDATHRDPTVIAPIDFDDGRGGAGGGETPTFESSLDLEFTDEAGALETKAPAPPAPPVPDWSFSDEASLVSAATGASGAHGAASLPRHDLDEIERRISGLELVDDRLPSSTVNGAVLVLAGIGGPDAVRQLLGALPENFDRPVLVQQRLDGGRYDKLVAQMQRATSVLVKLAEVGARTIDGVIYILPAGVGIEASDSGIQFVEGGDVLGALPAGDSAVLLFSGADPAAVDAAMTLSAHGALIAGQAPDGCYDAAAASAAIARGAGSGQPAELAAKLASRWSRQSPI